MRPALSSASRQRGGSPLPELNPEASQRQTTVLPSGLCLCDLKPGVHTPAFVLCSSTSLCLESPAFPDPSGTGLTSHSLAHLLPLLREIF